ncbi:MAG TPA: glycosyltransferase 87 family protein [Candidatus Dormibacteraeota bacterium]|nr:glycosyltransferase 87 family protein [Candidatus Dormibacteraeota bacterium]
MPWDGARRAAAWRWAGAHRRLIAVLVLGALVRAILVPITSGPDFLVWDLASKATLQGVNVYAHHPAYHGGPYAYLPLFLDVEVPMQWLSLHTGVSFTILGKLPIVAADAVAAVVLARLVRRAGGGDGRQALASGLFFLNPLVVYDGAFYGRFDSVCVALLLLAVSAWNPARRASWRFAVAYALSIAAKTFPVALLPWLLRRGRITALRVAASTAVVVGGLSAPYLVTSAAPFLHDQLYNLPKVSGSLSWQVVFHGVLPEGAQVALSQALLGVFALAAVGLAFLAEDLVTCTAVLTLLFIVLSKVVIEQYLTWPLAFLALLAVNARSRVAAALLVVVSAVGILVNPYIHPFGREPAILDVLLAVVILCGVVRLLRDSARRGAQPAPLRETPPTSRTHGPDSIRARRGQAHLGPSPARDGGGRGGDRRPPRRELAPPLPGRLLRQLPRRRRSRRAPDHLG